MSGETLTSPTAQLPDAELMARARIGDMNSYEELYRRHLPDARRAARIVANDRDEAEDILTEAFTRLLDRLQRGAAPGSQPTPYLHTIIRRLAVDRYRESSRERHPGDPEPLDVLPSADDEIYRATERDPVRVAFETLPERWQKVLWSTEIEGRAATTLVPSLGSSANAVASLAYHAREGLRQAYSAVHLSSQLPGQCKEYAPKLASYIREKLPQPEDVAVAIHLDMCSPRPQRARSAGAAASARGRPRGLNVRGGRRRGRRGGLRRCVGDEPRPAWRTHLRPTGSVPLRTSHV